MFCTKCGKEIKNNLNFCPYCGNPVKSQDASNHTLDPVFNMNTGSSVSQETTTSKPFPIFFIILLVLCIVIFSVIGFLIFSIYSNHKNNNTEDSESINSSENINSHDDKSTEPNIKNNDNDSIDENQESTTAQEETDNNTDDSIQNKETDDFTEENKDEYIEDDGIHDYEIIIADLTWREAFNECRDRGGYLVHFNSVDEYNHILELLDDNDYKKISFYIGGTRDIDSDEYYWMNANGDYFGNVLNAPEYSQYWLEGEPSMDSDEGEEFFMDMFYRESDDRWYWNDVPNDVIALSDYYKSRMGYICEYE